MTYDDSATQTLGTAAILALSQGLPNFIGHPVAAAISYLAGNRVFSPTFRAISLNQWVAHDGNLTARQLRQAIRKVYQNQGKALYDFYHNLDRPEEIRRFVKLTPRFEKMMQECMSGELKQGTLMLMPHLSGFNLSGLCLAQLGFKFLTLAIPNPNRGYAWQNKLRNDRGMEVVPLNMEAMQHARQRLQSGGTVLTGIDRPIDASDHEPSFFGRKAQLPVAYVKLALKTNARVFVIGFQTLKDSTIIVDVSPQVEFEQREDPHEELVFNAEKVLKIAEQFIRLDPSQWMMFLPVWPDVKYEVPSI
jgi:phosphatidylinositol dimannoside acyltransferase